VSLLHLKKCVINNLAFCGKRLINFLSLKTLNAPVGVQFPEHLFGIPIWSSEPIWSISLLYWVRQGYHSKENNITQKLEKKKFSCPNGK
jgi:hypothetical protein